jgi:hypothetical protein
MIYAAATGMTPEGPDLGSRGSAVLTKPEVALLTGTKGSSRYSGVTGYDVGEAWHLMAERFQIPVTLLDMSLIDGADLSRYTTLVMAGGRYGDLPEDKIAAWVRDGGTLVTLENAAAWPVACGLVEMEEKERPDLDSLFQDLDYSQLSAAYGAQGIGGSIFEAELDATHPLAFGYAEPGATTVEVPVFRTGTTFYAPSESPATSIGTYDAEAPRLSGYVSEEMEEVAKGAAAVETHRVGRGRVVMLMDNPNFRAFWYGTNGLFLNAVFFGDQF